jgi:hypothetical protein
MASSIRTGATDGTSAPDPTAAAAQATTDVTPPPVAVAATTPPSEPAALDDMYKDSKRKVPNGPDPIHNRYCYYLLICTSFLQYTFNLQYTVHIVL